MRLDAICLTGLHQRKEIGAGFSTRHGIAEQPSLAPAAKALQDMGCNYGQGYYFSEPIEVDLALQHLRTLSDSAGEIGNRGGSSTEEDDSLTIIMLGDSTGYPPQAKVEEEPQ